MTAAKNVSAGDSSGREIVIARNFDDPHGSFTQGRTGTFHQLVEYLAKV